jgi:hypothetical protein
MEINQNIASEPVAKTKKTWSKPKLFSGKGIGFLGLGHVQTSTGPYGTPS